MSVEQQKIIIFYYGVTGHGKGLVDAMSGFGVKGPLRRAVLTIENFDYKTADDIYNFLIKLFENDVTKHYYLIHPDTIKSKKIPKNSPLPIKGCQGILTKTNICSCANCLVGKFMSCNDGKGSVAALGSEDTDDSDSDSGTESESSDNESDSDKFDEEVGQIRTDNVLGILSADSTIALFSHSISIGTVLPVQSVKIWGCRRRHDRCES